MKAQKTKRRSNSWARLPSELKNRLRNALLSVRFVFHFFCSLILIGGLGVWIPYLESYFEHQEFIYSQNFFTYSLAILGAMFMEYTLSKRGTSDLGVVGAGAGILALLICSSGYFLYPYGYGGLTIMGSLITIVLFLFVYANDEKFDSEEDEPISGSTGYAEPDVNKIEDR